jgi:hypothetical protein
MSIAKQGYNSKLPEFCKDYAKILRRMSWQISTISYTYQLNFMETWPMCRLAPQKNTSWDNEATAEPINWDLTEEPHLAEYNEEPSHQFRDNGHQ